MDLKSIFTNKIHAIISIYTLVIITHLSLSALKMYPFSDRLFLYMTPVILLILGVGIRFVIQLLSSKYNKNSKWFIITFPVLAIASYILYFPYQDNHILELEKNLISVKKGEIYFTKKSSNTISNWIEFTNYPIAQYEQNGSQIISLENIYTLKKGDVIVSNHHEKIGYSKKKGPSEKVIKVLLLNIVLQYS